MTRPGSPDNVVDPPARPNPLQRGEGPTRPDWAKLAFVMEAAERRGNAAAEEKA